MGIAGRALGQQEGAGALRGHRPPQRRKAEPDPSPQLLDERLEMREHLLDQATTQRGDVPDHVPDHADPGIHPVSGGGAPRDRVIRQDGHGRPVERGLVEPAAVEGA